VFQKICLIYFWELVQDLPISISMMLILVSWNSIRNGWSVALAAAGGGISSVVIVLTERFKSSITTDVFPPPDSPAVVALIGVVFSVLIYAAARYFIASWSSVKSDIPVGIAIGTVIAIFQFMILMLEGNFSALHPPRALMHALAFITAMPLGMLAIRKGWKSGTGGRIIWTALSAMILASAISAIDYFPFMA
jgi:hypothetical protein